MSSSAGSAGSSAKNAARSADSTAKGVADSRAVEIGARVGLACYGITHLLIAWLALVWIANQYMSIYNRLRLDIKSERLEGEIKEEVAASAKKNNRNQ